MTMAHSLEARPPLLDHKLVEFAATIPARFRLNGRHDEVPVQAGDARHPARPDHRPPEARLRGAARTLVPRRARRRSRATCCCRTPAASAASSTTRYVERLLQLNARGRDLDLQLWTMLSFEMWCRRFLDASPARPAAPLPSRESRRQSPAIVAHGREHRNEWITPHRSRSSPPLPRRLPGRAPRPRRPAPDPRHAVRGDRVPRLAGGVEVARARRADRAAGASRGAPAEARAGTRGCRRGASRSSASSRRRGSSRARPMATSATLVACAIPGSPAQNSWQPPTPSRSTTSIFSATARSGLAIRSTGTSTPCGQACTARPWSVLDTGDADRWRHRLSGN